MDRSVNYQTFSPIEWLNKHLSEKHIDGEGIQCILYFTLLWSCFESEVCDGDANMGVIPDKVRGLSSHLDVADIEFAVTYFKDRYLCAASGQTNDKFEDLRWFTNSEEPENTRRAIRERANRETAVLALTSDAASPSEIVTGLLFIIYRLRNNLYHGTKRVAGLWEQVENFQVTNLCLAHFLDAFRRAQNAQLGPPVETETSPTLESAV